MVALKIFLAALFGYLVGGINPAYIVGRLRGFDIRKKGSGNAGASNALIVMGKAVGICSALFDILKAACVMWLAPVLFPSVLLAPEVAGVACIFGHICPVYMKFKGGKGLACLGGVILGVDWRMFFVMLAAEILIVLIVDYICIIPITASIALPICYGVLGVSGFNCLRRAEGGWMGAAILAIATIGILLRHRENLQRIAVGRELHFSYLWMKDKDAELARVGHISDDNANLNKNGNEEE